MLCYSNLEKATMLMIVAMLAVSSIASPTDLDGEASLTVEDVRSFPLMSDRSVADVNAYILSQLSNVKKTDDVNNVQTKITAFLQGTYGNQTNWLVYVAQNFNLPPANVSVINLWRSITGNVTNKIWTVYWAAAPIASTDFKQLVLNRDAIRSQLLKCPTINNVPLTASMVYTCLGNAKVFSGRDPNAMFIFISSNPANPTYSLGQSPRIQNKKSLIIIVMTITTTATVQIDGVLMSIVRTTTITIISSP